MLGLPEQGCWWRFFGSVKSICFSKNDVSLKCMDLAWEGFSQRSSCSLKRISLIRNHIYPKCLANSFHKDSLVFLKGSASLEIIFIQNAWFSSRRFFMQILLFFSRNNVYSKCLVFQSKAPKHHHQTSESFLPNAFYSKRFGIIKFAVNFCSLPKSNP